MKKQDKMLTVRLEYELYQKYVNETLKRSNKENRLIRVSEIIREVLEKGI